MDRQPSMIKNFVPSLMERGKIKIGEKGKTVTSSKGSEFQPPKKLDYFKITTMLRGADGNFVQDNHFHSLYGNTPKSLPVVLLYDDLALNFQSRYSCFKGRQQWCTGDGESATRLDPSGKSSTSILCPCERINPGYQGPEKCKANGCLSVIIDGAETVGGVWKLRTTSYNSVVGILSSLTLIKATTGGQLAGIPLELTVAPKTVVSPSDNRVQTIYVVGLEYKGSFKALRQIGYNIAMDRQKHQIKMENIEIEAKKLLGYDPDFMGDSDDVVDEFYSEQAVLGAVDQKKTSPPEGTDIYAPTEADAVVAQPDVAPLPPEPPPGPGSRSTTPGATFWDAVESLRGNYCPTIEKYLRKVTGFRESEPEIYALIKEKWGKHSKGKTWPIIEEEPGDNSFEPPFEGLGEDPRNDPKGFDYLQEMTALKKEIITIDGNEEEYRQALSVYGAKKSPDVPESDRADIVKDLKKYIDGRKVDGQPEED